MRSIIVVVSKRRLILLILIPLSLLVTAPLLFTTIYFHNNIMEGKTIVIDAGHGGVDGGANNSYILEKDVNLEVALKLQRKLESNGAKVIMTRTSDVDLGNYDKIDRTRYRRDLKARLDMINNSSADIFISIHTNSNRNKPSTRGVITYYYTSHPHNRDMAYIFQNSFNIYGFNYEGKTYVSHHIPQKGKYYLLAYSKIPGIIIETGFITNSTDLVLLQKPEYREYLADTILRGTVDYFLNRDKMPDKIDGTIEIEEENVIDMAEEDFIQY